jgi:hypothetical protein
MQLKDIKMSIDHNRIKVADLEKNQPNKILSTNSTGELEFSDINNSLDCIITGKVLDARQGKVLQDNKEDKVTGKSLLSDAEIARLATLSNYTHPVNHPPSIISQDPSNRFVTDTEKAIWNAKQTSMGFTAENLVNKNLPGGYAGLGADGKLISSQLPSITISDTFVTTSQATMLALTAETGDVAVRTDLNKSFILKGTNPTVLANWQELLTPTSAVSSVFGRNGVITASTGDYKADQITETLNRRFQTDNQKIFNDATSSIQGQLNGKVALNGTGATGTWGINISGNSNYIAFNDGPRNLSDRLPNSVPRSIKFDFVNAATIGGSGNYGGVMSFNPWDGTTPSTGDSSYQLGFLNETGINGSGLPGLKLRKGIDSIWGAWCSLLHSGNYGSYSAFSGTITGASLTVSGDVTAFSDERVKENIRPITNVIERIQASRGILYDRIDTKQKDNIGFIAQELEETFPELVLTKEDGTKAVKYQNAVAVLFEAIKEQQIQIDYLINKLKN